MPMIARISRMKTVNRKLILRIIVFVKGILAVPCSCFVSDVTALIAGGEFLLAILGVGIVSRQAVEW